MLRHQNLVLWEERLKQLFDKIDDCLEDKYGGLYPLHPQRARRGSTSNREHDGLFNVGASYSLGTGSQSGKGYVVEVRMETLHAVPSELKQTIEKEVAEMLKRELPATYPERELTVTKDGNIYKITGDFSLGNIQ